MIYQNTETENTQNKFSDAISELKLGKSLRKSNITKNCGLPAYEVLVLRYNYGHEMLNILYLSKSFLYTLNRSGN